jgi:formylglycine-generating enzyme required for sulfatase activity
VLNYQWYVNDENNTRTGNPITNAEGDSYTMQAIETMTERTMYYYVEITSVVEGKTGITQSAPCRVTFINKGNLTEKSVEMADIPAGTVTNASNEWTFSSVFAQAPWSTPGIRIGSHLVTYELWETVRERAEAAKYYSFAQNGNQGAASGYGLNTNQIPQHIGNKLNPVTSIGWRTAVVWCNAYSEMDGKQPVYRGFDGEPLRDSRDGVEALIDESNMNWNGYRLPTFEEWLFAARGAVPSGDHRTDKYTGTDSNDFNEIGKYLWSHSSGVTAEGVLQTGEVGSLHPLVLSNGSMLYDMMGMVYQFVWKPAYLKDQVYFMGSVFTVQYDTLNYSSAYVAPTFPHEVAMTNYVGFRVARNRGE